MSSMLGCIYGRRTVVNTIFHSTRIRYYYGIIYRGLNLLPFIAIPTYLCLMMFVSFRILCGICGDHWSCILDNLSIFQYYLPFHTRMYLFGILDFCFLLADPFLCKQQQNETVKALKRPQHVSRKIHLMFF